MDVATETGRFSGLWPTSLCSKVIVLLQGDPTIERPLKCKPILSINERKDILKSLKQIDYIEVYNLESELLELLKSINPDVRFLGDDYKNKPYTGDDLGIDIHYIKRDHGWSTTKFKNLIAKSIWSNLKIGGDKYLPKW